MAVATQITRGGLDPPEGERRVRELLELGAVEEARALSCRLAETYPEDRSVQKLWHVLAPPRVVGRSPASGRPISVERAWIKAHGKEYAGSWIAVLGSQLLIASANLADVIIYCKAEPDRAEALIHFEPAQ